MIDPSRPCRRPADWPAVLLPVRRGGGTRSWQWEGDRRPRTLAGGDPGSAVAGCRSSRSAGEYADGEISFSSASGRRTVGRQTASHQPTTNQPTMEPTISSTGPPRTGESQTTGLAPPPHFSRLSPRPTTTTPRSRVPAGGHIRRSPPPSVDESSSLTVGDASTSTHLLRSVVTFTVTSHRHSRRSAS